MSDCPPLLPGLEPMRFPLVEVRSPKFTRYGSPEPGWVVVSVFVDALLHEHGIEHEHREEGSLP